MERKAMYIWFVLIGLLLFACSRKEEPIAYYEFEEDATFIPSTDSKLFEYSSQIIVSNDPTKEGGQKLVFYISVEMKDRTQTLEHFYFSSKVNESLRSILFIPMPYNGFPKGDTITLKQDNYGLKHSWSTSLKTDLKMDQEELEKIFKEPIRVLVGWDHGQEYVEIPSKKIEVIYK